MTLKMATLILFLISALALCICSVAVAENHCNDQESWREWEALVQNYPDDMDLHTLHALRIGLCAKMSRGDLSVDEATEIFERARDRILEKKKLEGGESGKLGL